MTHSEIIREVRESGEQFAAAFGHDLHRICEELRTVEQAHKNTIQKLPNKTPVETLQN